MSLSALYHRKQGFTPFAEPAAQQQQTATGVAGYVLAGAVAGGGPPLERMVRGGQPGEGSHLYH